LSSKLCHYNSPARKSAPLQTPKLPLPEDSGKFQEADDLI